MSGWQPTSVKLDDLVRCAGIQPEGDFSLNRRSARAILELRGYPPQLEAGEPEQQTGCLRALLIAAGIGYAAGRWLA